MYHFNAFSFLPILPVIIGKSGIFYRFTGKKNVNMFQSVTNQKSSERRQGLGLNSQRLCI
jgi:hypothetical protein